MDDLLAAWSDFSSTAYKVRYEDDSHSARRTWKLEHAWNVPDEMSLIAGDAAHNLRCALDHICYHLVNLETSGAGPFNNLYFPIGDNQTDFREKLRRAEQVKSRGRVIRRLGSAALKAIEELEPYGKGKGELFWHLNKLDIIDKHHLLLTVVSRNPTHTMPASAIARYKGSLGIADHEYTPIQEAAIFQTESFAPFPLLAGSVLASVPLTEAAEHMTFNFDIAFDQPAYLNGKAVIPTLYQIAQRIRDVIREFDDKGLFG